MVNLSYSYNCLEPRGEVQHAECGQYRIANSSAIEVRRQLCKAHWEREEEVGGPQWEDKGCVGQNWETEKVNQR